MLKNLFYALVCLPLGLFAAKTVAAENGTAASADTTAYDFSFHTITGEDLPLARFRGQPILVVNTASECGFTGQYADLQALWETYGKRGLVVIAVPSNDFGGQEPGDETQIKQFCQTEYGVNFYLAAKEPVKGEKAHPFYAWMRERLGVLAAPKWNFHKYLIGPDGKPAAWFASTTSPTAPRVTQKIETLLKDAAP